MTVVIVVGGVRVEEDIEGLNGDRKNKINIFVEKSKSLLKYFKRYFHF